MTAAIIAFEQNPATGMLYSILLDGVDVATKVGYDTIHVSEAGPGGVSSMSFVIVDPTSTVVIEDNAFVQSWDYARDLPLFTGYLETQSSEPLYGGAGRDITVTAVGIESVLDQVIVPALTSTPADTTDAGDLASDADILQVVASNTGLRTGAIPRDAVTIIPHISQQFPISNLGDFGGTLYGLAIHLDTTVVLDGLTVRSAFETWLASASVPFLGKPPLTVSLTVDFWRAVRKFTPPTGFWATDGYPWPDDWTALTIVETPAAGTAAATLRWTRDVSVGAVVSAVYVKGGNAAGTGWVVGDTTQGRHESYISDSSILTYDARLDAANAVLGGRSTGAGRGVLTIENFTPINAHPGGSLVITNAALGWSAKEFIVTQIDKTLQKSGKQDWAVSFADIADPPTAGPASFVRTIRPQV